MYLKTDGSNTVVKWPYTIETLKQENPNVSFPDTIPESVLNSYNVHLYLESAMPDYDGMTETLVRDTPHCKMGLGFRAGPNKTCQMTWQKTMCAVKETGFWVKLTI